MNVNIKKIFACTTIFWCFVGYCQADRETQEIYTVPDRSVGGWGKTEFCPTNTSFVTAISVKIQKYMGVLGDDTGLNGVRLYCREYADISNGKRNATLPTPLLLEKKGMILISKQGPWGKWLGWDYCHKGVAVGFEVRTVKWDDGWLRVDNTAADDMRLICSSSESRDKPKYAGNGGHKGSFGDWKGPNWCQPGFAVCGLKTQVLDPQGSDGDDIALNSVKLYCCPLPEIRCNASLRWEEYHLDWTQSPVAGKYTFKVKTAVSTARTKQSSLNSKTHQNVKISISGSLPVVESVDAKGEVEMGKVSEQAWSDILARTLTTEEETVYEIAIKPYCYITIYRVIGACEGFTMKTNHIKAVYRCDKFVASGSRKTRASNVVQRLWISFVIVILRFAA